MRFRAIRTKGIALAVLASLLAVTPGAMAQKPKPAPAAPGGAKPLSESLTGLAKAEYEAGRLLYGDKDYANAIVKFEQAHNLSKDPRLLWNIAVCQKNLRRYSRMLATIKRYQTEAGPVLTADEKEQANAIVKTVEAFVSRVRIASNEAGADVFVDDEKVGETPLAEPVIVDVGQHRFKLQKPGFKEAVVTQQIGGGGEVSLALDLDRDLHRGTLSVTAGPNDLISLDGKTVGLGKWEGVVTSGGHTLKVSAPGMAIHQSEAVVQDNETRRIDVVLNPLPRDTTKTVLWIVGGAALVAGGVIGGVFLFKPSEAPGTKGTLSPGNTAARYQVRF